MIMKIFSYFTNCNSNLVLNRYRQRREQVKLISTASYVSITTFRQHLWQQKKKKETRNSKTLSLSIADMKND